MNNGRTERTQGEQITRWETYTDSKYRHAYSSSIWWREDLGATTSCIPNHIDFFFSSFSFDGRFLNRCMEFGERDEDEEEKQRPLVRKTEVLGFDWNWIGIGTERVGT